MKTHFPVQLTFCRNMKNKRVESPARSSITISKCHIQVIERFSLVSDGPQSREIYRFCLKDVNRIDQVVFILLCHCIHALLRIGSNVKEVIDIFLT